MSYHNFSDDESVWLLEPEARPQYIVAPSREYAVNIGRRLFDEVLNPTKIDENDIESLVRGPEPPFSVIVPKAYYMVEYEKRVNQAGFKGVYERKLRY